MECVGEFEAVTSRGKTITRVIWERPCSVCGAFFRLSLSKDCPPEAATSSTTCFEHSAEKRKRKAERGRRAKYRSPNRKRRGASWTRAEDRLGNGARPPLMQIPRTASQTIMRPSKTTSANRIALCLQPRRATPVTARERSRK